VENIVFVVVLFQPLCNHGKFNNVIVVLDYQKSEQKYEIFIICNNLEPARKIKKNKIK